MKWNSLLFILFVSQLIVPTASMAQTSSRQYILSDAHQFPNSDADVIPLGDGNVLLAHMQLDPDHGQMYNQLVLDRFGPCHHSAQQVIDFSSLYGIRQITANAHRNDSILLVGRASSNEHPFSEGFLLTMDDNVRAGTYHYYRHRQGVAFFDMQLLPDGRIAALGYQSSTSSHPSTYIILLLNPDYSIDVAKEFTSSFAFSGAITFLPSNELCIRTAQHLIVADLDLNVRWSKAFHRNVSGGDLLVHQGGIVVPLNGWYGPSDVQVLKLDFDGNVIWRTPQLNPGRANHARTKLVTDHLGNLLMHVQSVDLPHDSGDNLFTSIGPDGAIMDQWSLRLLGESQLTLFTDLVVDDGATWVSQRGENGAIYLSRADHIYPICGAGESSFARDTALQWYTDMSGPQFYDIVVQHGSFSFKSIATQASYADVCEPVYPRYDILPDEVALCSADQFEVDLTEIDEPVFWSDGYEGKRRVLDTPGLYGYGYGACQDEIAEWITVGEKDCTCDVYIPTAFSPNGDGINDVFEVYIPCGYDTAQALNVYNRWGQEVFRSDGALSKWDGRVDGKEAADGTYVYQFTYQNAALIDKPIIKRKGEVVLMR